MPLESVDAAEIAEELWREGYVFLPGFFDAPLMDQLNALITAHFGERPDFEHSEEFLEKASTEVVPWFPQREGVDAFDAIENNGAFKEITKAVLGKAWENQYCMVMFSKAGTAGQAWHQDCPPEGEFFNLNRLVYTNDITPDVGGEVVVMPRTHKRGALSVGEPHADMDEQIVLAPKKGDLLMLHGHCWHRVLPIKKGHRYSTNYRAASAGAPEDLTDICVYRNMRFQFSTSTVLEERC